MEETLIRPPSATALLVGAEGAVPSELGIRVFSALTLARMRIVRVGGPELACERMVTTMPQVVVTLGLLDAQQRVDLGDHAAAVGAVMVELDPALSTDELDALLTDAVERASTRSRRGADLINEEYGAEEVPVEVTVETVPPPRPDASSQGPTAPPPQQHGADADDDKVDDNW